jgi:hypothetical protein
MSTPSAAAQRPHADVRSLIAALLLFAATVGFVSACGGGDLIFPGMNAATATSQNTATPVPTN